MKKNIISRGLQSNQYRIYFFDRILVLLAVCFPCWWSRSAKKLPW